MDGRWKARLTKKLLAWYEQSKRDLPWRSTTDPYAIWVSEIMLQQTQVATVLPYYYRFLSSFPTVHELANAEEQSVLRHWEGLGYYRRAKQLHAAARAIVERHGGVFPQSFEEVLALPGIGRYTAGAICSFAYDQATPIVEANTQRLYARLLCLTQSLADKSSQTALWKFASDILPEGAGRNARSINHALMELGALVCSPKPDCDKCPLLSLCPTAKQGLQTEVPVAKKKTVYTDRAFAVVIVRDHQDRIFVRKCAAGEWWEGLWDFPRIEITDSDLAEIDVRPWLTQEVNKTFGLSVKNISEGSVIRHSVTRYRIQLRCFSAQMKSKLTRLNLQNQNVPDLTTWSSRWVTMDELIHLPLSASGRKVSTLILVPS